MVIRRFCLCLATGFFATSGPEAAGIDGAPAFLGAEGYGASAKGGRGGRVLRVTSLEDTGVGTLRAALEAEGPRIVVFDVGGLIELEREILIQGGATVAGQTAPGDGIVVRGARLTVAGDDVIVRGLKIRPGAGPGQDLSARDGLSIGVPDKTVRRVIVDRNSFAFAPDENAAVWNVVEEVTFSNNIIADGLEIEQPALNSFGLLVGEDARRVSILSNLFVRNVHRNPQVKSAEDVEVVGNVVYGWGPNGTQVEFDAAGAVVASNLYAPGPDTVDRAPIRVTGQKAGDEAPPVVRAFDNRLLVDGALRPADVEGPVLIEPLERLPSGARAPDPDEVLNEVLETAGAPHRDAVDAEIAAAPLTGARSVTLPEVEVPAVRSAERDCDGDGMIDRVEAALGFDPRRADAQDASEAWTRMDHYLDHLAAAPLRDHRTIPYDLGGPILVEAETLDRKNGFAVEENVNASGGAVIRAGGGEAASASFVFSGPTGFWDAEIGYFDEGDGRSRSSFSIGDEVVDSWIWDRDAGGPFAGPEARVVREVEGVWLETGDLLTLAGEAEGEEALRVDFARLSSAGSVACPLQERLVREM